MASLDSIIPPSTHCSAAMSWGGDRSYWPSPPRGSAGRGSAGRTSSAIDTATPHPSRAPTANDPQRYDSSYGGTTGGTIRRLRRGRKTRRWTARGTIWGRRSGIDVTAGVPGRPTDGARHAPPAAAGDRPRSPQCPQPVRRPGHPARRRRAGRAPRGPPLPGDVRLDGGVVHGTRGDLLRLEPDLPGRSRHRLRAPHRRGLCLPAYRRVGQPDPRHPPGRRRAGHRPAGRRPDPAGQFGLAPGHRRLLLGDHRRGAGDRPLLGAHHRRITPRAPHPRWDALEPPMRYLAGTTLSANLATTSGCRRTWTW